MSHGHFTRSFLWFKILIANVPGEAAMEKNGRLSPLNVTQINPSIPGFTQTTQGFSAANPNVGTITNTFKFTVDPWQIPATSGANLCDLSNITLSLSKVFNPNNTTDSFYVLSWDPNYFYRTGDPYSAPVTVGLLDVNGATLDVGNLGGLNAQCGLLGTQTLQRIVNPIYFDRVARCVFTIGPGTWYAC